LTKVFTLNTFRELVIFSRRLLFVEGEALSDDELFRQVVELIETEVGLDADNFEIEINDGALSIFGDVPSEQANERLERILYDSLDFDDVEYEVVVDEDLQAQEDSLPDADPDDLGGYDSSGPNIGGDYGSESPRRQY
jgi:hypothetical protein